MTAPGEEHIRRGRPPWWLVGVFVVVAAIVVAGLVATGYRGQTSGATTTTRPPALSQLVARADLVVTGDVTAARRLGDPSDPAVVAMIDVDRVLVGSLSGPVTVHDKGFTDLWQEGQHVLLFLKRAQGPWRVQQRYLVEGTHLRAPFTVSDVLAAAHRS